MDDVRKHNQMDWKKQQAFGMKNKEGGKKIRDWNERTGITCTRSSMHN